MKASTFLAAAAAAAVAASFLALGARAQPLTIQPFASEGYTFESPSGARLWSINNEGYNGMATTGNTKVYAPSGALIYEIPVFTGWQDIYLSPDATIVVLDGNWYHGTQYMKTPMYEEGDPVVTRVYLRGESWRNVTYNADLGGPMLEEEVQWGWSHRPFSLEVDWTRHVLAYDVDEFNIANVTLNTTEIGERRAQAASKHVEISLPGIWDVVGDDDDDSIAGS